MLKLKYKVLVAVLAVIGIVLLILTRMPRTISSSLKADFEKSFEENIDLIEHEEYAILIDYSLPIFTRRLWIVNLETDTVVLNVPVSHALNSGWLYANNFSNELGSRYSCTGAFISLNDYESSFGKGPYKIGMRINGVDSNNDNAFVRNIVFHCSRWPWSGGCFMTSPKNNKKIIDLTKNGSFVFVGK